MMKGKKLEEGERGKKGKGEGRGKRKRERGRDQQDISYLT